MITDANDTPRVWSADPLNELVAAVKESGGNMIVEMDNGALVPWHYIVSIEHRDDWNEANTTVEESPHG